VTEKEHAVLLIRKIGAGLIALPTGRLSKWLVVIVWLAIVFASVALAGKLSGAEKNKATVEFPRGAQSTFVTGVAKQFPNGKIALGLVVYERDSGITAADRAKAQADRPAFAASAAGPVSPAITSPDGKALLVTVPLRDNSTLATDAARVRTQAQGDRSAGRTVQLTGPAGSALDASDAQKQTDRAVTGIAVLVIIVILLLTYRSPVLWLLPLLNVGAALGVTEAVSYLLAKHAGLTIDTGNTAVITVLVFGIGTDYALLLLARYREELRSHADPHAAMAVALRRAAPAIAASAAIVGLSLLCLTAAHMGFNHVLGPVGAIAVVAGLVTVTTLLPALLLILGRWVFWPRIPHNGDQHSASGSVWERTGSRIVRRPRLVWVSSTLILAAVALGSIGLKTGLNEQHSFVGSPGSIAGQNLLAAHFHAGQSDPVEVVANARAAAPVGAALGRVPGVAQVQAPVRSDDGRLVLIDAVLTSPPQSAGATSAVQQIRTAVRGIPGADAAVGGITAVRLDEAQAQTHDRNIVIPLVLAVVLILLMVMLRAIVAPLLLIGTVLLSYFAALGISWLLFTHVFGFPAVDVQLKLIGFLFLVALGVDYNIFLVFRIRQEVTRHGHRHGVLNGLAVTGGVITSAGLVLAATFLTLTTAPQVAFIQIGVMVAIGVLLDTFLVRSVLVPALALDVGRRFWWPSALARDTRPPAGPSVGPEPDPLPAGARPTGAH
jgi:RND superfamily putative drug exporter